MKKKILFLLAAIALCLAVPEARAQTALIPAIDTLTNTDTARLTIKIPGKYDVLSFQFTYTKISGTSASTVLLQGSNDGVDFATIKDADTATVTNVAGPQTFLFKLTPSPYLWYRLYGVTSGTQSGQVKAVAVYR